MTKLVLEKLWKAFLWATGLLLLGLGLIPEMLGIGSENAQNYVSNLFFGQDVKDEYIFPFWFFTTVFFFIIFFVPGYLRFKRQDS